MDFVLRPRLGFEPNADVFVDEESGQVVVAVEVAGADPESLRVAVDDRYLSITGRRTGVANVTPRGSFIQKEIAYGAFGKRIALPVAVDFGDVVANYADGVLVIALPISPTAYLPATRTEIRMIVKRTLT
ncbi:MAG TPA: Hsp20/alpha crystallin family protein [Candidatus Baltobacteraceae bacterium]|jgi:HSP20 family molecular chaperone IbpA|nr:Hsp20/alpha crystallin family protein [Candidatus Baltobacteraceae bacterium]